MMLKTTLAAAALLLLGGGAALGQTQAAPVAADAAIGSRVALVCTSCHSARAYSQLTGTRAEWREHVYEMMMHGAQIRPDEIDPITDYLAATYPAPERPAPPRAAAAAPPRPRAAPAPAPVRPASADTGETLVNRTCTSCHALSLVTATRHTLSEWDGILTRMQAHGAQMSPAERRTIAAYLTQHYAR